MAVKKQRFAAITAKLDAMSPLKVLSRGYAMVQTETGQILRSVQNVSLDDSIRITLEDGVLHATVHDLKEHRNEHE